MISKLETAKTQVRVMIVDDHPTVREGLGHRIDSQNDMTTCGEASDVNEALKLIAACQADVVIVDIALKNSDGLELIKSLKSRHSQVRALVHTMYDESVYADRCLHAGALGYVNKESAADTVLQAIRTVSRGEVFVSPALSATILGRTVGGTAASDDPVKTLTNRQLEIFRLIGRGKSAAKIAEQLHISIHTVETHRENIKRKLNVHSTNELTRQATLWEADQH